MESSSERLNRSFMLFAIVSLIAFSLMLISLFVNINSSPGTGEKVGQIILLNHRGLFKSTWEAQLIRGGLVNGSGAFGVEPFDFTIEDEALRKQVDEYRKRNTEVNIKYRIEGVCSVLRSENHRCIFLTGIEPTTSSK